MFPQLAPSVENRTFGYALFAAIFRGAKPLGTGKLQGQILEAIHQDGNAVLLFNITSSPCSVLVQFFRRLACKESDGSRQLFRMIGLYGDSRSGFANRVVLRTTSE